MAASQERDVEVGSCDSDPSEPCRGGPVTAPFRLLRRNPELAKVILTVGLQMAAADIAGTIDLGPDTNQTWKSDTSVYVATFAILGNIMSYATGPIFGRFADAVDRRVVLIVHGFITFLPTFVYWFCPFTETVVWATHVASVFAAIGRSSNVAFALSNDVTNFEDRALAAGLFYGLTNLAMLLLSVFPAMVVLFCNPLGLLDWYDAHPRLVLYYQSALVAASVVATMCIAKPPKRGAEDNCPDNESNASNADGAEGARYCKCVRDWVDVVRLLRTDERIRRLSVCAFFLSVARAVSIGNDGQFFAKSLGLYSSGGRNIDLQFDQMNVLRSLGAHIMVLPGFLLTGYFAMKTGTLKVLRRFVPATAVLVACGAFLQMIGHMWFVPVVVAVQTMGDLYQVPLMRLSLGVARPGRTGMWLSLVGMAVEAGDMLGNLVIIVLNATTHDGGFLWIFYPAAGAVALLGLVPLLGKPKLAIGWGAAAGSCREQFAAMMAARKLGRRWRNKTCKNPVAVVQQNPPACTMGSGDAPANGAESEESSDFASAAEDSCEAGCAELTSHASTSPGDSESGGAVATRVSI